MRFMALMFHLMTITLIIPTFYSFHMKVSAADTSRGESAEVITVSQWFPIYRGMTVGKQVLFTVCLLLEE